MHAHPVRRIAAVALAGTLAALGFAGVASAQSYPGNNGQDVPAQVAISETDSLTLNNQALSLSGAAGQTVTGTVTWSAQSNNPGGYSVQVASSAADFTPPSGASGADQLPWSDVSVKNSSYTPGISALSTTPQTVWDSNSASGLPGPDTYSITLPSIDPGTYTGTVVYDLLPGQ
jgi:hypothetical protein